jgi:predicted SAM-dependent methyltransferase
MSAEITMWCPAVRFSERRSVAGLFATILEWVLSDTFILSMRGRKKQIGRAIIRRGADLTHETIILRAPTTGLSIFDKLYVFRPHSGWAMKELINMRKLAERILRKVNLDGVVIGIIRNLMITTRHILWYFKRNFGRVDSRITESYFAEREIKKLHIGCGGNILGDWLNSDFFPHSDRIVHLDATDSFPFSNETFDYIFSEHMIEHISYSNGLAMLSECHRVLRNNRKIRISTPNLKFLIDLYTDDKSEAQREYIKWATDTFIKSAPYYDDTFVINNFVRDWGHLFIYDEKTLRSSLEKAGFTKIIRCDLNESEDESFRNLENEKRMPKGFLKLESVILEGTKVLDN